MSENVRKDVKKRPETRQKCQKNVKNVGKDVKNVRKLQKPSKKLQKTDLK